MEGETILCLATRAWHSLWRSTQQYMSRMSIKNRVLYFEPGRNPDRSVVTELIRNLPNYVTQPVHESQDGVTIIPTPSSLPYARRFLPSTLLQITTPMVAKMNALILLKHVQKVTRTLSVQAPILWLYSPNHVELLGKLGEKLVCYFIYDEYADFVANNKIKELIRQYDNRMSSQADVNFASSRAQQERRLTLNPNTCLIPNGVDFEIFHKALDPDTLIPSEVVELKKPIIGYIGWLGYQIDIPLLLRVAEEFSECSLILVGPNEIPHNDFLDRLRAMPNVYFLGRKKRSDLPGYLKTLDVALIPYRLVGYTLSAYPLKLHEYLAAGRAIVSVALPELRPYNHVVRIADTHKEFVDQISLALNDYSTQVIEARIAVAQDNTWDQRLAEIYRVLDHLLEIKSEADTTVQRSFWP